jgi:cytochrome b-561 domain containing protein 2
LAIPFVGFPSILLGALAISYNKYVHGAPHFTTWHGVSDMFSR